MKEIESMRNAIERASAENSRLIEESRASEERDLAVELYLRSYDSGKGKFSIASVATGLGLSNKQASELLRTPYVSGEIRRRLREEDSESYFKVSSLIEELCIIAKSSVKDVLNPDGSLKNLDEIDDSKARAIKSVTRNVGEYGESYRVEFHDKNQTLRLLASMLRVDKGGLRKDDGSSDVVGGVSELLASLGSGESVVIKRD